MMMCSVEGCEALLRSDNKSGLCKRHLRQENSRKWRAANPEQHKQQGKKWREENPEKAKENSRNWYVKNQERHQENRRKWYRENLEKSKESSRRWYDENREKKREYDLKRRVENPERKQEQDRRWRIDNPEKVKEYQDRRRAMRVGAFVEEVDRYSVWCRDAGLCFLCCLPADEYNWHLSHVIPLDRGGEHSYANTAVMHPPCNLYQGNRLLEELDMEAFLLSREQRLA